MLIRQKQETPVTLKFNDISHYNGTSFPIGGPIIAKATEGSNFTDSVYASNKKRTQTGGWPFCAYHFPLRAADASMEAQAAHALAVIGTSTPVMMDIEKDVRGHWISRDDCLHQIDLMQAKGMKVTLAYIPKWFWQGEWGGASLKPFADRGLGLVSSQYVGTYSDSGPGWDAYGGVTPIIWQFTDGLDKYAGGGLHHADTNAFKGTIAELAAVFAGLPGGQGSAPITGDDDMATVVTVPAGYSNAGKQVDAGTALTMLLSMQLDTRNRVIKAAASADPKALAAELAPLLPAGALTQAEIEAALRNVFADAAS